MILKPAERAVFLRGGTAGLEPGAPAARLYFGDEFCDRRLPSDERLERLRRAGALAGGHFTLVTPPLTEEGLARAEAIMAYLTDHVDGRFEVVVNDWGLLSALGRSRARGRVEPVLGRILSSRFGMGKVFDEFPDQFLDFVRRAGIARIEFNLVPQLLAAAGQLRDRSLKAHLYWPHAFATWSRFCGCAVGFRGAAKAALAGCGQECESSWGLADPRAGAQIAIRGNAYLVKHEDPGSAVELAPDRLIEDADF